MLFVQMDDFNQLRADFDRVSNPLQTVPDGQRVLILPFGCFGMVLHSEPERDLFHVRVDSGFTMEVGGCNVRVDSGVVLTVGFSDLMAVANRIEFI